MVRLDVINAANGSQAAFSPCYLEGNIIRRDNRYGEI
jgi:hypothetical protein